MPDLLIIQQPSFAPAPPCLKHMNRNKIIYNYTKYIETQNKVPDVLIIQQPSFAPALPASPLFAAPGDEQRRSQSTFTLYFAQITN